MQLPRLPPAPLPASSLQGKGAVLTPQSTAAPSSPCGPRRGPTTRSSKDVPQSPVLGTARCHTAPGGPHSRSARGRAPTRASLPALHLMNSFSVCASFLNLEVPPCWKAPGQAASIVPSPGRLQALLRDPAAAQPRCQSPQEHLFSPVCNSSTCGHHLFRGLVPSVPLTHLQHRREG